MGYLFSKILICFFLLAFLFSGCSLWTPSDAVVTLTETQLEGTYKYVRVTLPLLKNVETLEAIEAREIGPELIVGACTLLKRMKEKPDTEQIEKLIMDAKAFYEIWKGGSK